LHEIIDIEVKAATKKVRIVFIVLIYGIKKVEEWL
jgi:hypothetical protein